MNTTEFLLVALPVFLTASVWLALRVRREYGASVDESAWTGEGLEVRRIAPRLRQVRTRYVLEARSRATRACQRRGALAVARQALASRPFFRHHQAGKLA